uniref:Uncharacterized protein n=1 Tax=Oryza brachyantha TaxID=4533 RepID=J3MG54_ORYBR
MWQVCVQGGNQMLQKEELPRSSQCNSTKLLYLSTKPTVPHYHWVHLEQSKFWSCLNFPLLYLNGEVHSIVLSYKDVLLHINSVQRSMRTYTKIFVNTTTQLIVVDNKHIIQHCFLQR